MEVISLIKKDEGKQPGKRQFQHERRPGDNPYPEIIPDHPLPGGVWTHALGRRGIHGSVTPSMGLPKTIMPRDWACQ